MVTPRKEGEKITCIQDAPRFGKYTSQSAATWTTQQHLWHVCAHQGGRATVLVLFFDCNRPRSVIGSTLTLGSRISSVDAVGYPCGSKLTSVCMEPRCIPYASNFPPEKRGRMLHAQACVYCAGGGTMANQPWLFFVC